MRVRASGRLRPEIVEAAEMFPNIRYRRYPVATDGRPVGMIGRYDVLRALQGLG
jgi:CBS domain-containing protein